MIPETCKCFTDLLQLNIKLQPKPKNFYTPNLSFRNINSSSVFHNSISQSRTEVFLLYRFLVSERDHESLSGLN